MRPTILEREGDLASIDALIDDVGAERGGALLLRAPAGMGKSTLLEEARGRARGSGLTVLSARGGELEREFAFGVVRQVLERPLREAGAGARARWLTGPSRVAVSLLEDHAAAPAVEELALLHGLYWLALTVSAERPLLLVVDDAHWADDSSLRWMAFLARRLEGSRIGLLAASRPADPRTDPALLDAIAAELPTRDLAPLSRAAAADVVRASLGGADEAFVDACHSASGGNPFLLAEVVSAARAAGIEDDEQGAAEIAALTSEHLRRAVLSRIRAGGAQALDLARAAAVLGDEASLPVAARLAGVDEAVGVRLAHDLVGLAVLAPGPRLAFAHALLRAAVLADLGALRERREHARAAELLAQDGAAAERIAAHLLACDPVGEQWALDTLEGAATQAISRGSPATGARLLERALGERPDDLRAATLEAALGGALATAGDPRGLDVLLRARAAAPSAALRCSLAERIALPSMAMGLAGPAAELLDEAGAEAARAAPELVFRLRCLKSLMAAVGGARAPLAESIAAALESLPDGPLGVDDRAGLSFLTSSMLFANMRADRVAPLAARALGTHAEHEEACDIGYPMGQVLITLAWCERPVPFDEGFTLIEEALLRRGALAVGHVFNFGYQALYHHHHGELAAAESAARTGLGVRRDDGFPVVGFAVVGALAATLVDRGAPAEALTLTDDELVRLRDCDTHVAADLVGLQRALALTGLDRHTEAESAALAIGARCVARGTDTVAVLPWRSVAAEAQLALGRSDAAADLAAQELELARAFGAPGPTGRALRVLGLARGDIATLRAAEAELAGSTMRLEHARALIDLGAALRRTGARAEAREPLAAGMELAHRCGALPLEQTAHDELLAAGARPRSVVRTGVDALTASERRTAQLAADGLTNRDIAQRLFVTPKTVETHLGAVYRKLGVAGRGELGAALAGATSAP